MNKPDSNKEKNLVKGSLRRIFSRSELRQQALDRNAIKHSDPMRPRVTAWSFCQECGIIEAQYKMDVDHKIPIIELGKTLADYTWDEVVERMWCGVDNLQVLCSECHDAKSGRERKERARLKKLRGK